MALTLSTSLRNFMLGQGSFAEAFDDSELMIYSGNAPSTADAAVTGTLLATLTTGSATYSTASTPQMVEVACSGTDGTGNYGVIVTGASGSAVTYAVLYATSNYVTTRALALLINKTCPDFMAVVNGLSSATLLMVARRPGNKGTKYTVATGATGSNTCAVTSGYDLITFAASNGLRFGGAASGAIAKNGTWSGTAVATGTAGYWRLVRAGDTGASDTTYIYPRLQGSCGVGTGDILMSTTSIVSGASQTVDSFSIELPATI